MMLLAWCGTCEHEQPSGGSEAVLLLHGGNFSHCPNKPCAAGVLQLSFVLQLAPFPFDLVCRELRRYPNAEVRPAYVIRHAICLSACIASGLDKALHCMILQLRPSCDWMHGSVQGWLWRYSKAEPGGAERPRHPPLSCKRICR